MDLFSFYSGILLPCKLVLSSQTPCLTTIRFIHEFSDGLLCGVVTVAVLFFLRIIPVRLFSLCVLVSVACVLVSVLLAYMSSRIYVSMLLVSSETT